MAELTISQVAEETGLRPSTLRYYEKIGLLLTPKRICGRRRYERSVLCRLALIVFAKKAGFRLREIRLLRSRNLTGRLLQQRWRQMAEEKRTSLELIITQALEAKARLEPLSQCGCRDLDECGRRIMRSSMQIPG
jgi:DNA-binding transcriptional MerR regulator